MTLLNRIALFRRCETCHRLLTMGSFKGLNPKAPRVRCSECKRNAR